ncbi:MAG: hypothetical protein R3E90_04505 [Marinicella sp.]|nr:hypothetical protein [Xanthomonadales bacterium]
MNKKTTFVFLIIGVIGLYAITLLFNDDKYAHPPQNSEKIDLDDKATLLSKEGKVQQKSEQPVVVDTEKIIDFNEVLSEKFRPNGTRKPYDFNQLKQIAKVDQQKAIEMIMEMVAMPDKNLLALADLNYQCSGLKQVELQIDTILLNRPFEKALWDSGYCSRLGTESDPFFDFLNLARKGNKEAQLLLMPELFGAIERGSVNPRTDPIFYDDLRKEVISYLKSLSSQGVSLASLKLSKEYLSNGLFFSKDKVLATFYLTLYEEQHSGFLDYPWDACNANTDFCRSPEELYKSLSDIEKDRVDSMLARKR